jgi:hypothetical protein
VVGVSEDLIAQYLAELRAKLRTADADEILAEAEDHLRESAAAGMAIGMSDREAEEMAISAFGTVRTVARANHRRTALAEVGMAARKFAAVYLLTVFASGFVMFFVVRRGSGGVQRGTYPAPQSHAGQLLWWAGCGIVRLVLLHGYLAQRRRGTGGELLGGFFPLAATVFCVPLGVIMLMLDQVTWPRLPEAFPAALVVAVGYAVQMVRVLSRQADETPRGPEVAP